MKTFYSADRNAQILVSLMKAHGIKKVVASPGVSNMNVVASLQHDPYFEIYSSIDERSAAYMACGLAAESGEAVAITCTGATASRNYMPGLTEAFYRKLPILAITSTQDIARIGHNSPQLIDRRVLPNDVAKLSVHIPNIHTQKEDDNYVTVLNTALLELKRQGGGPVHVNITSSYSGDFSAKTLPPVSVIRRIGTGDNMPVLPKGKIGIFVGAHKRWPERLTQAVEAFCSKYNAFVLVDQISNYRGKYSVFPNLVTLQRNYIAACSTLDLMIYIGDIYGTDFENLYPNQVWRVNIDGEIRDTFGGLTYAFEMDETDFFEKYIELESNHSDDSNLKEWKSECQKIKNKLPDFPFSNIWIGQQTMPNLPDNSVIHFGIQNSLRTWNFFEGPNTILGYCNTGGFGIDGNVSSLVGASLANKDQIYFGVIGDLAFFYDMNALGNRHIGNNVRLIIVNNGRAQQFRNPYSAGEKFGERADRFIAAAGHYGNQSKNLVKNYSQDLGFEYISASNKEEYIEKLPHFVSGNPYDKSIIFEVFPNTEDEIEAMKLIKNIENSTSQGVEKAAKKAVKTILGEKGVSAFRKIVKNK